MVDPNNSRAHHSFVLLPDPPADYAPGLVAENVSVISLVRALVRGGLQLTYSVARKALVIEVLRG